MIDEAIRRPSPLSRESGRPVLVFTGDAKLAEEAVEKARYFDRRAPHAEIDAGATGFSDVTAIVERLTGIDGLLARWVRGTLLPPPRFPLTRFVLWAWGQRDIHVPGAGSPPNPVVVRNGYQQSLSEWRKKEAFTGPALRRWADYVSRTMTTWLPASGLAAFGLQTLMDRVSLVLWLVSPVVAVICALLHAALLIRGLIFYRWFRRAPFLTRKRGEDLIDYAMRFADPGRDEAERQEEVERLMVTALLEDLRQAYRRRVIPWPGWGRHTYPVVRIKNADPGSAGRRFVELVDEVRVSTGQRGPLLLVVSTSQPPTGHRAELDTSGTAGPVELYRRWQETMRRVRPSSYLVINLERDSAQPSSDRDARLFPVRPLAFWAVVLILVGAPITATLAATVGCGTELHRVAEQCVGLGPLDKMAPHRLVKPAADQIELQNGQIPFGSKVFTIAYLGPLTTQPGATFKDGQMTAVAGELAGIGAYQDSFNKSKSDWKMKVVFANTGQDFFSAELAATSIGERALEDPSLTAAVGFAWSRVEVKKAVEVLTKASVPMVSTVSTVDEIANVAAGRRSAYLFRLAVVDSLQMKATVHWLDSLELAPGAGLRPRVAVVWQQQEGELYSRDLKDLFLQEYGGEKTEHGFADDASLDAAVKDACASGAKVIYYTGRADFLSSLKRAWGTSCEKQEIKLLASDDVTGSVANDVRSNPGTHDVSMSFVSLTDVRSTSLNQGQKTVQQWAAARSLGISVAHAAFSYDAAQAVGIALNAYRTQSGTGDIRSGVHYNLRGQEFDGATGKVSFSAHASDHDAQNREVWLTTVESRKPFQAILVCRPTAEAANCGPAGS
ncbi:ABC transporter substrate-binding protein [Nonomuraea rubra]